MDGTCRAAYSPRPDQVGDNEETWVRARWRAARCRNRERAPRASRPRGMTSRGVLLSIALGFALAASLTVVIVASQPDDVCGCSVYPTIREPALAAARAFHRDITDADPGDAWPLLSPAAQARYGDSDGFATVVDRLRTTYADPANARWLVLAEWIRFDAPSEAAVVLYGTGPSRFIAAVIVQLRWGATDPQARIDPEPVLADPVAVPDGRYSLRIELPVADDRQPPPNFLTLDADGAARQENWRPAPAATVSTAVQISAPVGEVVVIYAQRTDIGWRLGSTTATVSASQPSG